MKSKLYDMANTIIGKIIETPWGFLLIFVLIILESYILHELIIKK